MKKYRIDPLFSHIYMYIDIASICQPPGTYLSDYTHAVRWATPACTKCSGYANEISLFYMIMCKLAIKV